MRRALSILVALVLLPFTRAFAENHRITWQPWSDSVFAQGDTLSMGRAFLGLYACTGDRAWLQKAARAVEFISKNFGTELGYVTSAHIGALKSQPQLDENIGLVRLANLLWHYTGNAQDKKVADRAMRFVSTPGATEHRGYLLAGVLLADHESTSPPLHITVVGRKDDQKAEALFAAAIRQ